MSDALVSQPSWIVWKRIQIVPLTLEFCLVLYILHLFLSHRWACVLTEMCFKIYYHYIQIGWWMDFTYSRGKHCNNLTSQFYIKYIDNDIMEILYSTNIFVSLTSQKVSSWHHVDTFLRPQLPQMLVSMWCYPGFTFQVSPCLWFRKKSFEW